MIKSAIEKSVSRILREKEQGFINLDETCERISVLWYFSQDMLEETEESEWFEVGQFLQDSQAKLRGYKTELKSLE